jgi:hypothetical protein
VVREEVAVTLLGATKERAHRVENIAAFMAFYIDGHDPSWGCVAPEREAAYRFQAEALLDCALGYEAEAVAHGESPATWNRDDL